MRRPLAWWLASAFTLACGRTEPSPADTAATVTPDARSADASHDATSSAPPDLDAASTDTSPDTVSQSHDAGPTDAPSTDANPGDTPSTDAPSPDVAPRVGTASVTLLEPHEDPLWTAAGRHGGLFATPNSGEPPELVVGWWDDDLVVIASGERLIDERHPLRARDDCPSRPTLTAVMRTDQTLTLTFERPRCPNVLVDVPLPDPRDTRLVPARSPVTAPILGVSGFPAVTRDGMHVAVLLTSSPSPAGPVAVALSLLRGDDGSTLVESPLIQLREVTRDATALASPLERMDHLARALRGRFAPVRALLERAELHPMTPLAATPSGFGDALVEVRVAPTHLAIAGPGVEPTTVDLPPRELPKSDLPTSGCRATPTVRGAWFDPELGTLLLSLDYGACRPERATSSKLDFAPTPEWRVVPLIRRR